MESKDGKPKLFFTHKCSCSSQCSLCIFRIRSSLLFQYITLIYNTCNIVYNFRNFLSVIIAGYVFWFVFDYCLFQKMDQSIYLKFFVKNIINISALSHTLDNHGFMVVTLLHIILYKSLTQQNNRKSNTRSP